MEIRLQNALNIINDLECHPGITSTEIAHNRSLSVPTISNIVSILKNNDIVMTTGTGASSGGRKPVCLSLNPRCRYSIGVSIARHTVYLLLMDFAGHIYEKERFYIQFEDTDAYWYEIRGLIDKMQEKASVECSVGIALPGFVYEGQSFASDTYTLGKPMVALDNIYRIVGENISIDDSCRLAAMAQVFGKSMAEDNFFVLLSRRVSGILICDRNIVRLKASSIDVGAMLILSGYEDFEKMKAGSVYEFCSASRIVEYLKKNTGLTGYDEFFEEIRRGNTSFLEIWDSYLKDLSMAIYNIYSIFKVTVVIGGEMANYIEPYASQLETYVKALSPKAMDKFRLKCSIYGEYDDAFGAALLARAFFMKRRLPEILKNAAALSSGADSSR